jgi:hypothetical protein
MTTKHRRGGAALAEKPTVKRQPAAVKVLYPGHREQITHPNYTIQVAMANPEAVVEISVAPGDWRACREALGLWWYDWSGYGSGAYELVARQRNPDGTTSLSMARVCEVKID